MKISQAKTILIASDHAGFDLKKFLIEELERIGFCLIDLGCNSSSDSVDYPDFAQKLSKKLSPQGQFGILICGSGIGISIAANRSKHVRAALCYNTKLAKMARAHNDANVLCIGSRFIKPNIALAVTKTFLKTEFESGRHARRVEKLSK